MGGGRKGVGSILEISWHTQHETLFRYQFHDNGNIKLSFA